MSELYGKIYTKHELLERTGHLSQVGGVQSWIAADGPSRGVRFLEFRTGSGLVFKVALDRGMDIGYCEYRGSAMGWIPPTQLSAPWYYSEEEGFGWLRTVLGGLLNTCGLVHIGNPDEYDSSHYGFEPRKSERFGVHDRIALAPARLLRYGEEWREDRCVLEAVGELRQAQPFGENLRMLRTVSSTLGSTSFTITDVIENCGFVPVRHQLLYHIQFGFPFVMEGGSINYRKITGTESDVLAGSVQDNDDSSRIILPPQEDWNLQVFSHQLEADDHGMVSVVILQPESAAHRKGVYLRYRKNELPTFLQSNFMGKGFYAVGLEPATNSFRMQKQIEARSHLFLEPGEYRRYKLEIGVLDGQSAINKFTCTNCLLSSG